MKKLLISLLVLTASFHAFALKEYYSISRSIRALGMGGAFYGWSNDEYALFYNPAGLSLYSGENEFMLRLNAQAAPKTLSAISTISDASKSSSNIATTVDALTQYQGTALYAGAGILPFYFQKNFGVGLLLADTKMDVAVVGKELDTSVDLTAISDSGLVIGYGRSVPGLDELHLGLNAKTIFRAGGKKVFSVVDIAQGDAVQLDPQTLGGTGVGLDFDLGATYELSGIPWGVANRVSLSLNNLLASRFTMSRIGGAPPGLTRMASFGYYTVFEGWKFIDNFHVLLDFAEVGLGGESDADYGARGGSVWKHVNFGVEMPIGRLALRTGFRQGYITAGLGINLTILKIDFATYGEELASSGPGRFPSRRFAVTLAIGGGAPPTPVMSALQEKAVDTKVEGEEEVKEKAKEPLDPKLELKEAPKSESPAPKKTEEKPR